jgi:hypothetical protein
MSQAEDQRDVGVRMIALAKGQLTGQKDVDGWRIAKGKRFRVTLDWSAAGTLVVSSDGITLGSFRREFDPTSLKITVSTGELMGHLLVLATK